MRGFCADGGYRRVLKPNGWLQMTEFYYNVQSDNGTLTETNALRQWSSKMLQAYEGRKDLRAPLKLERMFREAGLVDLETRMIPIPLNGWPRGRNGHQGPERSRT